MWTGAVPIRRACGSRESGAWAAGLRSSSCATSIWKPSVQKPLRDAGIAINTAVAQEWPVAADVFQMLQVALADQDFFLVVRRLNDDPSKGVAEKRSAPEFQALALGAIAADIAKLVANPVDHADKHAVGDGMGALNCPPCVMLHSSELSFLVRVPADSRGIKENICALQSGQTRAFRIPLVPADEGAHASILGIKGLEAKIARSEVEFLVIKRIVRDVHLTIEALGAAIGIKNDGGVVVEAACAAFEDRNHYGSFGFAGDCGERFRRRSRNCLGEIEERCVFPLAEILRTEKLRQADHLRALFGGGAHFFFRPAKIVVRVGRAMHL